MATAKPRRTLDELSALGNRIFDQQVRPMLRSDDDGRFVAIDVDSGEFEIDSDDYTAVARLRSRKPLADVWLIRAGSPATCRIGDFR
jgi:hypothetical protein